MMKIKIIDDEPAILDTLSAILADEGYQVTTASGGAEALKSMKTDEPDIVMLDIWMPHMDGMEVLNRITGLYPAVLVIIMSGHGSIETAVRAIKEGAYDYIEKPLSLEKVCITVSHAVTEKSLKDENRVLRDRIERKYEIIGESTPVLHLKKQIMMAAPSNSRVLISGENGTGKELVAMAIHHNSSRSSSPFIEVNCAAIPENLIESELLGHERGAFTGADNVKRGKFEQADKGTIFLDEIADMSLPTQAKVLRVLQEQRFSRVGGSDTINVDVRVVAASNKNLEELIRDGLFRQDLYYRLNVIPIVVPPLRDRKDDIALLAGSFLDAVCNEERIRMKKLSGSACRLLQKYSWPGNVRELKNIVQRLAIMTESEMIGEAEVRGIVSGGLVDQGESMTDKQMKDGLKGAKDQFERKFIISALEQHDWNISKTAVYLQIERSHLYKKMKSLEIG